MTTPVPRIQLPAVQYTATPANPHSGGLYSAATMVSPPDAERMQYGAEVEAVNEGSWGTWDSGCGDQDDPDAEKAAERANPRRFAPSIILWAADDCSILANSKDEAVARVNQIFRLKEEVAAETSIVTRLLSEAGTLATAPVGADAFAIAVGAVEEAIGLTGTNGVIHVRRGFAALAASKGLVVQSGNGALRTPLGNRWAFGAGYGALGDTLVGTGPVTVRRGELSVRDVVNHRRNERSAVAERLINVSWEITTVGQEV